MPSAKVTGRREADDKPQKAMMTAYPLVRKCYSDTETR